MGTVEFIQAVKNFSKELGMTDKKIKTVQMYSDYHLPDGSYPFIVNGKVYYPLTLIYRDNSWRIHWIEWEQKDLIHPALPYMFYTNDKVIVKSAENIPERFDRMLEGRKLMRIKNPNHAELRIQRSEMNPGKINGCFAQQLAEKINERLIELSGCNLSAKWDIDIGQGEATVMNGKRYSRVNLSNFHAEGIWIGVSWDYPCDVSDDISDREVEFYLTEEYFEKKVATFERIIDFIQYGGPRDENNWAAYPKVTFVFSLKPDAPKDAEENIYKSAAEFVEKYNADSKHRYKIKECTLVSVVPGESVSVFIDFGRCNIEALSSFWVDIKIDPRCQSVSKMLIK